MQGATRYRSHCPGTGGTAPEQMACTASPPVRCRVWCPHHGSRCLATYRDYAKFQVFVRGLSRRSMLRDPSRRRARAASAEVQIRPCLRPCAPMKLGGGEPGICQSCSPVQSSAPPRDILVAGLRASGTVLVSRETAHRLYESAPLAGPLLVQPMNYYAHSDAGSMSLFRHSANANTTYTEVPS